MITINQSAVMENRMMEGDGARADIEIAAREACAFDSTLDSMITTGGVGGGGREVAPSSTS